MRVSTVLLGLVSLVGQALALPPPEYERVLVVFDDSNADIEVSQVVDPLKERGFKVQTAGVKDHAKLQEYGERLADSVILLPGRVKALGSTMKMPDLFEFMELGGNIVALTTPRYAPAVLRDVGTKLGIEISGRGVQYQNNFETQLIPDGEIVKSLPSTLSEQTSVAKLSDNEYLLALLEAPYTGYAWNAGKDSTTDTASNIFGAGNELVLAAALQSTIGSRFVWLGSADLLKSAETAKEITGWALHEFGELRLANAEHSEVATGESHLHYSIEQDLRYCADIEEWDPELPGWKPYRNIEDVELEFKMLNPYYRLNLNSIGCVEFKTPEQYGMFTFQVDYRRPGLTFLEDKQVVTIHHRANNEWDRSWSIANSWVYLAGVGATVIGFLVFVFLYVFTEEPAAPQLEETPAEKEEKPAKKDAKPAKKEEKPAKKEERRTRASRSRK